ncbi:unnamed protein product, partial [marine sediment metagenome]
VVIYDKDSGGLKAKLVGTSLIASGAVTKDKIYDGDPFTIQQTSAPQLRHLLHGSDYQAVPTYNPIAVDASGYMYFKTLAEAHAAEHQAGGPDQVNVSGLTGLLITPQLPADDSVTSAKIASGAVGIPHIYPGAIVSAKIAALAVGIPHITANAIVSGKVASGGLAPLTSGKFWAGFTGNIPREENKYTNANAVAAVKADAGLPVVTITFIIDGGGSAITTGQKGHLEIPFACTINRVTMLADQSGSIVVDIWKDTYANFPPDNADSITASAPPTITTAQKSQDSTLTGWTR